MKNKIDLKNFKIKLLFILVIILLLFLLIDKYEYKNYTQHFNNKINSLVDSLQEKYPNLTEKEIINILNSQETKESKILKKYNFDLDNQAIIKENDQLHYKYVIINITLLILSLTTLIILFINYLKAREKKINDITTYLEQLNKKNYSLKLDSNSEDELSILKNEIYKTTVMLKETKDISLKDKSNLKKSLEDISHQLKTPITSILIMLDNLIEDPDMDIKIKEEFLRDIKRNITNINFLVQSILKLSKFDANTISFVKEKSLIKDIINESCKNISPLCDLKNIKINVKGNNMATINCDLMWQVEALTNIIKNCVEHSFNNSKIDISYEQNNAYTTIIIKDYGKGIPEKEISHIFERFYKGQNSSSDSMGIGLALAKTIIEKDNGIINVKSNNNGTEFIIKYFNF